MSLLGDDVSELGLDIVLELPLEPLVDMSLDDDGEVEFAGDVVLEPVDDVSADGAVVVAPWVPVAGSAEFCGLFGVLGTLYGAEAEFGELLLGTELVCAIVTPAAVTMATTAAMLRVLDALFMCLTPFPKVLTTLWRAAARQLPRYLNPATHVPKPG